jgi:hypothetical protein
VPAIAGTLFFSPRCGAHARQVRRGDGQFLLVVIAIGAIVDILLPDWHRHSDVKSTHGNIHASKGSPRR